MLERRLLAWSPVPSNPINQQNVMSAADEMPKTPEDDSPMPGFPWLQSGSKWISSTHSMASEKALGFARELVS